MDGFTGQAAAKRAKEFENEWEAKMNGKSKKVEPAVSDNKPTAVIDGTFKANSH